MKEKHSKNTESVMNFESQKTLRIAFSISLACKSAFSTAEWNKNKNHRQSLRVPQI